MGRKGYVMAKSDYDYTSTWATIRCQSCQGRYTICVKAAESYEFSSHLTGYCLHCGAVNYYKICQVQRTEYPFIPGYMSGVSFRGSIVNVLWKIIATIGVIVMTIAAGLGFFDLVNWLFG